MERINFDVDYAIHPYQTGKSLQEIGRQLGIARETLARRMKAAGLKMRTNGEARLNYWSPRYAALEEVVNRYIAGETIKSLCTEFEIGRRRLENAIRASGHQT